MICMVKAQLGAGMAPSDLLVASSQAGPALVAQQSLQGSRGGLALTWHPHLLCFMVEVAKSPKTGGITVKRKTWFWWKSPQNAPKMAPDTRSQISKFSKTIFGDGVKKSRSRGIF
jgi:hypothetical protein